jgi:hypothetical protein
MVKIWNWREMMYSCTNYGGELTHNTDMGQEKAFSLKIDTGKKIVKCIRNEHGQWLVPLREKNLDPELLEAAFQEWRKV